MPHISSSSDNSVPQQKHLLLTPPKLCHFQSQHSTKCWADSLPLWVVLFPIFSPPHPPHHLWRKEKTFCPENKKVPTMQTCKQQFLHPCCLMSKCGYRCQEVTWDKFERGSSTSSVVLTVIAIFLPFFSSLGERGSALRVLHRNHRAHNNRRKPVTWVTWARRWGGIRERHETRSKGKD